MGEMAHLNDSELLRLAEDGSTNAHVGACASCSTRLSSITGVLAIFTASLEIAPEIRDANLAAVEQRLGLHTRAQQPRVRRLFNFSLRRATVPIAFTAAIVAMALTFQNFKGEAQLTSGRASRTTTTIKGESKHKGAANKNKKDDSKAVGDSSKTDESSETEDSSKTSNTSDSNNSDNNSTATTAPGNNRTATHGYWVFHSNGSVDAIGTAKLLTANNGTPSSAVDGVAKPSGDGYWIVTANGTVYSFGAASHYGNATMASGDHVVNITSSKSGNGYTIITSKGNFYTFGDASLPQATTPSFGTVLFAMCRPERVHFYVVTADTVYGWTSSSVHHDAMNASDPVSAVIADPDYTGWWAVKRSGAFYSNTASTLSSIAMNSGEYVVDATIYGSGPIVITNQGRVISRSSWEAEGNAASGNVVSIALHN